MRHLEVMLEAKRRLIERLRARPELAGVQVSWGDPGSAVELEGVIVGRIVGDQDAVATGHPAVVGRQGTYVIDVLCESVKQGGTQEEADVRAAQIATAIEDACREPDGDLGGLLLTMGVSRGELTEHYSGEGRSCVIALGVECTVRA